MRDFVDQAGEARPSADWYERGELDLGLMKEAGSLGLLGMHLEGYGCAGTNAVSYGLACLELEAGDSGVRSMVSVQGSLAMFAIWKFGSEEQKKHLAAADGRRRGDRLLRPDRGGLRLQPGGHADPGEARRRRVGAERHQDVDHQRIGRRRRGGLGPDDDEGIRGFLVPTDTAGFSAPKITKKLSLRASITSELVLEDVRLPADAVLPDVAGLARTAVLPERGPVRHRLRRARRGPGLPRDRRSTTRGPARSSTGRWRRSS